MRFSTAPAQPEIDFRAPEVRDADGDLLAPNGKKSKLTERQWHQVRSPQFKNWFGDWESAGHRAFLDGKVVASMKGDEVPVFDKVSKLAQWADDYFAEKVGRSVEHEQLGAITLNKRSVKDSLGHGGTPTGNKAKALWLLPDALPRMRLVARLGEEGGKKGFVLAAPVKMSSERYILSALVREDSKTRRMYIHEMDLEKELQAPSTDASARKGELNSERLGVMNSVLRDIYSVKPEDVSKVIEPETGEPMVVYHGTKADRFWAFLDSMLGSNTGAASARKGHFFAKSKRTAAAYQASNYTKEVFWQREAIGTQVAFDWFLQDVINPLVRRIDNDPTLWEYVQQFVKKHNITDGAKHPIISMLMAIEPNPGRMRDVRADDFASAEKLKESGQRRKLGHESVLSLIEANTSQYYYGGPPETIGPFYMEIVFSDAVKELEKLGENKLLPDLKRAQKRLYEGAYEDMLASAINAADQTTGADGENIYHEFLNIRNPLVHDFKGEHYREVTYNELLKRAREEGRSGAILRNTYDGGGKDDIFIVFKPSDIKSATDNIGLYSQEDDDTRFSLSPETKAAYEARVDALFGGAAANRVGAKVLDSSDLLGLLGHEGKPVYLKESKVLDGMENHPRMTADVWKKIPQWLENPAAVFDSDTVDGRLVFIAPETLQGAEVRLVIEPNADIDSSSLSAHLLFNAYDTPEARTPYMRWINGGLLRYADKKMFPQIAERVGLRLPNTALQNKAGTRKILTEKNLRGYRREIDSTRLRAREEEVANMQKAFAPDPSDNYEITRNVRALADAMKQDEETANAIARETIEPELYQRYKDLGSSTLAEVGAMKDINQEQVLDLIEDGFGIDAAVNRADAVELALELGEDLSEQDVSDVADIAQHIAENDPSVDKRWTKSRKAKDIVKRSLEAFENRLSPRTIAAYKASRRKGMNPEEVATAVRDFMSELKVMPDSTVPAAKEARTGRKSLSLDAMRKYPPASDATSVARTATLNARDDRQGKPVVVGLRMFGNNDTGYRSTPAPVHLVPLKPCHHHATQQRQTLRTAS